MDLKEIFDSNFNEDMEGIYRLFNIDPDIMVPKQGVIMRPFLKTRKQGNIEHAQEETDTQLSGSAI